VDGSLGEDISFHKPGEVEELKDGFTYEEFVPHEATEHGHWDVVTDSRVWVFDKGLETEIEVFDRGTEDEEPAPTNISQEGFYKKKDEVMEYGPHEARVAQNISNNLDMDVFAIDCVRRRTEDGDVEIIPYEVNSTAGTSVNNEKACDIDLYDEIAETIEYKHTNQNIPSLPQAGFAEN
jgi:hypothetical protein